jgi:hypothetical protein
MRFALNALGVGLLLPVLGMAAPLEAKGWDTVPEEVRSTGEPLEMVVHVTQEELIAGRDPADNYEASIGAIPGLMEGALRSMLAKGAQSSIKPTQDALNSLQADKVLVNAIRDSVAPIPWIKMMDGGPLRDSSLAAKSALLDRANGPRTLGVECTYRISQRFHAVYAFCAMDIAAKAGAKKPEARWQRKNLLYSHTVEAEIILANPAGDVGGRRDQWTDNSAVLLRTGLERALKKAGELVGRQLLLTAADISAAKQKPKERTHDAYIGMAFAHEGRVIEGFENILDRVSPNPSGKTLLFKPGTDGVVMLENGNNLFYYYSIKAN